MLKLYISLLIFIAPITGSEVLKLATTTSTYETGLLDAILPPFEKSHDVKIHCISVGTGKALKLGENGDVDIIMVHARKAEDKFVSDGYGVNRRDLMYNDFVILGPENDPAGIKGMKSAVEAFKLIKQAGAAFLSRGDNSGTHKKELIVWENAGIKPQWKSYQEVGQGMSATLRIADEKGAYVMLDRATWLSHMKKVRLKIMAEGDQALFNPYGVIAVSPYKHAHIKYQLAMSLIGWLTSPECLKLISEFKKDGSVLYIPNAVNPKQ